MKSSISFFNPRVLSCLIGMSFFCAAGANADTLAYAILDGGSFGTLDLTTGAYTAIGALGQTSAGLGVVNGTLYATSYDGNGTLFTLNTTTGASSAIGNSSIDYLGGFGSTLTGLYAVGSNLDLYSINPATGAATVIGSTGLGGFGAWRDLSVDSATLYFGNGNDLYTLSTSTGAATLVGAFGSGLNIGPLVTINGILYGTDSGNNEYEINTATGAATLVPGFIAGPETSIWGLAAFETTTTAAPEPASTALTISGLALLLTGLMRRRKA